VVADDEPEPRETTRGGGKGGHLVADLEERRRRVQATQRGGDPRGPLAGPVVERQGDVAARAAALGDEGSDRDGLVHGEVLEGTGSGRAERDGDGGSRRKREAEECEHADS
jgi:hypothetical protein